MRDQDRLQRIIETALRHGWSLFGHASGRRDGGRWAYAGYSVSAKLNVSVWRRDVRGERADQEHVYPVERLLFSEHLGLLEAACGTTPPPGIDPAGRSFHEWVGQQVLLLPDNQRLAFIEAYLRADPE